MSNLTIRFALVLTFVITLTLILCALDQSISNDILLSLLDAQAVALDGLMTPFVLDIPVASNDWVGVSCENLNNLAGDTIVDFSDKALLSKLELCNNI